MEDTLYHDDRNLPSYLNFLPRDNYELPQLRLNQKIFYKREKPLIQSLQLEMVGLNPRRSDRPIDLKRGILLENMHDPENICDFERIFFYSNWLVILNKDGLIQVQERYTNEISMGRISVPSKEDTYNINLKSNLCSKLHCQINFNDYFQRQLVPYGFYALLYSYENRLRTGVLCKILNYLGRDNSPPNICMAEMGSYLGTWLNIKTQIADMGVGDYFYIDKLAYIKVESIFHKEFDQIVKDIDTHNMQKLNLTPVNKSTYTVELLKLFREQKGIHTNYGFLKPQDYDSCVKQIMEEDCKFSLMAISTNMEDKNFTENFLLICIDEPRYIFDFDGIAVHFTIKKFSLEVKELETRRGVNNFWKSISWKEGERFKFNEITIDDDCCFMIQSSVMGLKFMQYD